MVEPVREGGVSKLAKELEQDKDYYDLNDLLSGKAKAKKQPDEKKNEEMPVEEESAEKVEASEETLVVAPEATITQEELKEASFFTTFMKKAKKVNWKKVWDKVSTGLLILIMAAPVLILAYIFYWFLTK